MPEPSHAPSPQPPPIRSLRLTGCVVDLVQRRILRPTAAGAAEVPLTTLEAELLGYLAARPGQDVDRDELLRAVWGTDGLTRAVDFTMRRLRAKLDEPTPPRHLLTAHGVGYRFVPLEPVGPVPAPADARPSVAAPPPDAVIVATGRVDLDRMVFQPDGDGDDGEPAEPIPLTAVEGRLLRVLAGALGRRVPRDTLVDAVWGPGHAGRALEGTLSRLRAKLDPDKRGVLDSRRGTGIQLDGMRIRAPSRTNLTAADGWIDRPEEREVADALASAGWVTVVGPGGAGKTGIARRVALAVAERGEAEAWFVDLTRATDADAARVRLGQALGRPAGAVDAWLAERGDGALIVLDNLEQLVDDPGLRAAIVGWRDGGTRLLATSREALGLPGEQLVAVGGLPPTLGVALYLGRAGRPVPVDDALVQLVNRLDGNPLAIELAAARAGDVPPAAMLDRMDRPDDPFHLLDLLIRRPDGASSHHSTLRGALDWSWDLLDPDARELLLRVAPIRGGLDPSVVAAATGRGDATDAGHALDALGRRSLLRRDGAGWRLGHTVRAYAEERLVRAPYAGPARAASAAALLDAAEHALSTRHASLGGAADRLSAQMVDLEWLSRGEDPGARGRSALVMGEWALHQGLRGEARAVVEAALRRGVGDRQRGRMLTLLASTASLDERDGLLAGAAAALSAGDRASRVELARARVAAHRDALRLDDALSLAAELAAEVDRDRAVPRSLVGRVWLDLASLRVIASDPRWVEPWRRADGIAREAEDLLLVSQCLQVRALGLEPVDPDGARACADALVGSAVGLYSPAIHHGAVVRMMVLDQVWGGLTRVMGGRELEIAPSGLRPVNMSRIIDVSAQIVSRWLDAGQAGSGGPAGARDMVGFLRAMGLLAAGAPVRAAREIAPATGLVPPLAALTMALADGGDAPAAEVQLARAAAVARSPSDKRILDLTDAYLVLLEGRAGALGHARTVLAAGDLVACGPGIAREGSIAVSMVRTRLEAALAQRAERRPAPDVWVAVGVAEEAVGD